MKTSDTKRKKQADAEHLAVPSEENVGSGTNDDLDTKTAIRRFSDMQKLMNVSASISSRLDLQEVLRRIVDAVVEITGGDRGLLMLADERSGALLPALARSKERQDTPHDDFNVSLSVREVSESGEAFFSSNVGYEEELVKPLSVEDLGVATGICVPLKFEENFVGVIYSDSDSISERFSRSDLSILSAFGAQAAIAIGNARRHGELESMSQSLETQNVSLREELARRYEFSGMIVRSYAMQQIFEVIRKVAPLSMTVLIQGETGTGKEFIAKAIHYNGPRKTKPIVSVNCGALPRDILESELFGYKKGAFTGADQDRAGLFEAASGGTILLDEIGEMSMDLQVKLLRLLQEGEIRRLGEDFSRSVDVRVVSATNRDLAAEVEAGNFRRDLFYRLNIVPIYVPPLRERQEDILPLAEFFLEKYSTEMKRSKPRLTRAAKELLLQHVWPGNVRELEDVIERALVLGEESDVIEVASLKFSTLMPVQSAEILRTGFVRSDVELCDKEPIDRPSKSPSRFDEQPGVGGETGGTDEERAVDAKALETMRLLRAQLRRAASTLRGIRKDQAQFLNEFRQWKEKITRSEG